MWMDTEAYLMLREPTKLPGAWPTKAYVWQAYTCMERKDYVARDVFNVYA